MPNLKPETKIFGMKSGSVAIEENGFTGSASGIGNMDQGGDVVCPGFFANVLGDFRANGFVPYSHKWDEPPVAMPIFSEERGKELYCEALFHSTDRAQEIRTLCLERQANGFGMGLSIGFDMESDGYKFFPSGKALWDWAAKGGYDMTLFDSASILAWKRQCRALTQCRKLYEYSPTPAPMNEMAGMSGVKTMPQPTVQHLAKGANLGSWVERSATLSACNAVANALDWRLWDTVYACFGGGYWDDEDDDEEIDPETVEAQIAELAAAFDEARDLCAVIIRALLAATRTEAEKAALQSELTERKQLCAADPEDRADARFVEKASALATTAEAFSVLASRRQETRTQAGRTLSQAAQEKIAAIVTQLTTDAQTLKALVDPLPDANPETLKRERALRLQSFAAKALSGVLSGATQ